MKHETDVVVVGAGPAGLFAVFQCGMVRLKCHVVDALDSVGGQCSALYPEKPIYDVPAQPSILAADLVERLQAQAAPFAPTYHLGRQMVGLDKSEQGFRCSLSDGTEILAKVVLIAAGSGAFGPNRPPLDGLDTYEGQGQGAGINYFVTKREAFRGKKVVIAGGGDSAVDWAISLSELAASVQVVHRRPKFRAAPESEAKLKALSDAGTIELVVPYQLHGLDGADGRLSAVVVATLDGQTRRLDADVLLPFFGLATELGPIAEWGHGPHRHRRRSGDHADQRAGHLRLRRHLHLSGQAEADPQRLRRGGARRPLGLRSRLSGRGAALRTFDQRRRAGQVGRADPAPKPAGGRGWHPLPPFHARH